MGFKMIKKRIADLEEKTGMQEPPKITFIVTFVPRAGEPGSILVLESSGEVT